MSALTVTVGTPFRSARNSASPVSVARAHFQRRHLDLESIALGRRLGAQGIRPAMRQRQTDVGPEGRHIRPFGSDLDVGSLDADATLDRDLAVAEAALQIDVAGQAPHPAIERSGGAGEVERAGLGGAETALDLQRLIGRRRPQRAARHFQDDRRPAGALGDGQHRVLHLDHADPRKGRRSCASAANGSRPDAAPIHRAAATCRGWNRRCRCARPGCRRPRAGFARS